MSRASLLTPPPGWMCHGCGYLSAEKPERCPKCSGSAFERTGAVATIAGTREPGGAEKKEPEMTKFDCVAGCGRKVSRAGGRCRTCAGLKRRTKKAARPAPANPPPGGYKCAGGCGMSVLKPGQRCRSCAQIERHRKESPGNEKKNPPPPLVTTLTVAEALKAAGFSVDEVHVAEATLLVRLTVDQTAKA